MAKIMLVEDDNNLREIYEARLAAEGYDIVSAQDGEEALALAVKERPDLIIADIMMPKVSGFDMLDILRGTPETKHAKIIMMTALSQAEDKSRAEKLGADRYLVKSQVTLEDVVKVASEILNEANPASAPASAPTPAAPAAEPTVPLPTPVSDDTSAPTPAATPEPTATPTPAPQDDAPVATVPASSVPVVTPPAAEPTTASSAGSSTADEETQVSKQIEDFITGNPTLTTSAEPAKTEPTTAPAATPEFTEEVIGTTPPPAAEPTASKATSIPVTQVESEPTPPAPAPETPAVSLGSDADQSLANAVDSLAGNGASTPEPTKEETAPAESDGPEPAKKRGGERVIEPLPSMGESKPTGDELIALASSEPAVGTQPPGAQTEVAGSATMDPTPQETNGLTPGQVIQAGNSQPPAGTVSSDPGSVAL